MSVSVPAAGVGTNNGWVDSDVTVTACQQLTVVASGRWIWDTAHGFDAAADGDPGSGFPTPTPGIPVFGLITYLAQDSTTPVNLPTTGNPGPLSGVYAASANIANVCTTTYSAAAIAAGSPTGSAPWRVWFRIADTVLGDNSGAITVTTTVTADPATLPQTAPVVTGSFTVDPNACTITDTLTWPAVALATGYQIKRNGSTIGTAAGTSYADSTGLALDTAYTYVVTAFNACGTGPASSGTVVTPTLGMVAPTVTACQPCCRRRVKVSWTAVICTALAGDPAATSYDLYRTVGNGSPVFVENVPASWPLKYTDFSVVVEQTYTYRVIPRYGCFSGPTGSATLTIEGYTDSTAPTGTFTDSGTPTGPYTDSPSPTGTFHDAGCGCGCQD